MEDKDGGKIVLKVKIRETVAHNMHLLGVLVILGSLISRWKKEERISCPVGHQKRGINELHIVCSMLCVLALRQ